MDRVLQIDDVSRAALHPGRRERPGARAAAARAGPDAALLPAVLRAVDARRLDRDARRRALRDRRDAHRRPRRVGARDHADRRVGVAAPAGLGRGRRRPTGCCSARRGSSASSPRRGCACARGRRRTRSRPCASPRFAAAIDALRAIAQSGLRPSNCRLIDAEEARMTGAARRHRGAARARLRGRRRRRSCRSASCSTARCTLCAEAGGEWDEGAVRRPRFAGDAAGGGDAVGAWRTAFLRAPYLRDAFVAMGILSRDVRDRDHVGALRRAARARSTAAASEAIGPGGRGSRAASRTSIPTGRRRTSPSSRRRGAARRSSSGRRSRRGVSDALLAAGGDDHPPPRGRPRPPALV